ncbi:SoxR reducing system RseC family protein [Pseudoramibacter porci]|uniref:SoxR reducing system RseC family protein n=1 Tax=Pseudoramibacter porci TaxID=2606631 RepID=A0A7X2NGY6_9FIRM|nr:SoxR reducing system RseC family protein [Pseudoramibacter porci]MSS20294.1 SoxR reducing system RseC family protein [Pseudoramibacter porci]
MIEYGTVKRIKKNNTARVIITRHEMCGDCKACELGTSKKTMSVDAKNDINAKVGDKVALEMEFANFMKASGVAYGFPLIGFLLGIFIGYAIAPMFHLNEVYSGFFGGLILMFCAYGIIHLMDRRGRFGKDKYEPVITNVIDPNNNLLLNKYAKSETSEDEQ